MKSIKMALLGGAALAVTAAAAHADDLDALKAQIEALNARVAAIMASPDLQNPVEPVTNINAIIDGRRQNLGSLKQEGLDVSVAYSFETDYGRIRAGLDVSKIYHVKRQTAVGVAEVASLRLPGPVTHVFPRRAGQGASYVSALGGMGTTEWKPVGELPSTNAGK